MDPKPPVVVSTLGDLLDRRMVMTAYCARCGRSAGVDLAALADRLGADHSYLAGALRLVCSGCGGRDVAVTISGSPGERRPAATWGVMPPTASGGE